MHIKNFIQSFMQLDLSSKCDAFVCYFGANQKQLAFNNRMRNKKPSFRSMACLYRPGLHNGPDSETFADLFSK